MTQSKEVRLVRLGDITQRLRQKCGNADADVSGIDINKSFIDTRANLSDTDISQYYLVPPMYYACNLMHIGRDEKIPIAYNDSDRHKVVTSAYYVFTIAPDKRGSYLPEYVNMFFHLGEFDRRTWFFTDSSVRGNLKENRFLDIEIPVPFKDGAPDVERQKEVVDIWQGLRRLKEENEAIAKPLLDLCDAKMDELKHSAPMVALSEYTEEVNNRNSDNLYTLDNLRGVSIEKKFIPSKANMAGVSLTPYKIVKPLEFCYVNITSRNGEKITLALNQSPENFIVSSSYTVFRLKDEDIFDPTYLFLWFSRPEFDRYSRFNSWGSAREAFSWAEMQRVNVPKPSIEIQRAIVDIYQCARRAKAIAEEADQQLKSICPALMQYIIHSAV